MLDDVTIERVASLDNLWLAWRKASKGKRRRADVAAFGLRAESHLIELSRELLTGSWQPGGYRTFLIHEPKRREIAAAPFRDRVVHHALCNVIQPVLERGFSARSYSCQKGKGTTAAREQCRQLVNRYRYVLKCDVRKFFPSIDHSILRERLEGKLRCPGVMRMVEKILGSYRTGPDAHCPLFPGDDLAVVADRSRGLPIGNLTSQLWGNFFLDEMDHWLDESPLCRGRFVRYTDDVLLFADEKAPLWEARWLLIGQLARLRLRLAEPKSRLLSCREGVPFCGFRFFPGLRPRILGATKRRFEKRRSRLLNRGDSKRLSTAVFAWYQFSREGNSEGLRRAYA